MNTDVCNYLFGSILSMSRADVNLSVLISVFVIILFVIYYNKIFAVTFDETFSSATGTKSGVYNLLIAVLTSLVIVVGMRMIGSLLISSLIMIPALCAMRVCTRFRSVVALSAVISVVCLWAGLLLSYEFSFPTGASIVGCDLAAFLIFVCAERVKIFSARRRKL